MKLRDIFIGILTLTLLTPAKSEACNKPLISWGATISFCQGNSIVLNATNPNATYIWSTGATTPTITVSTSGVYWVSVTNACGTTSDTIQVIVDAPMNVDLGPDRSICSGSPTILSVPYSPYASYTWSDGSSSNQISVSQAGTYWVDVTNACGTFRDTVHLTVDNPANVNLGADIIKCNSTPTVLHLPSGNSGSVLWSTGATGDSITVNSTGNYWVKLTNACGTFKDTIHVSYLNLNNLIPNNTYTLCPGSTVTLHGPNTTGSFLWSTGSSTSSITVNQTGTYWLQFTNSCGVFYDTAQVITPAPVQVDLGPDTTICANDQIVLDAQNPGLTYLWSTGATSKTIVAGTAGTYWVGVDNGCGFVYDTITVSVIPLPNPSIDDTIYNCSGSYPSLDAGVWGNNATYLWSDGRQTQVNDSLTAGAQWVKIMNSCDTVTKSFYIKDVQPLNVDLGPDVVICAGSYDILTNLPNYGYSFHWKGGSKKNHLYITQSGTFWVQVTNACGTYGDTIHVQLIPPPVGIQEDTLVKCSQGYGVFLHAPYNANLNYAWSTGDSTASAYVTGPGQYWLQCYNMCDTIYDTAYVVEVNPISFDLGPDTTFCKPAHLVLNLNSVVADSIVWSNGSHNKAINIIQTGTYWAAAYNACGVFSDTIHVVVNKPPTNALLQDASFCAGDSVTLSVQQNNVSSYQWNTGAVTSSITVSQPGWYYVDITNMCSTVRDSAYVTQDAALQPINLGNDTLFCGGNLVLDPGNFSNASYIWSTGDTSKTITVNHTGTYYVTVSNTCNFVSDTINVVVTGPPVMTLGNIVKFCSGTVLNLNAQNLGCTYQWSTGDTTAGISVSTAGTYWCTITNDCGQLTDSVKVEVEAPVTDLFIGNDTTICKGDSILLDTKTPGLYTKWQNGSTTQQIYVKKTGDYWVRVSNSCGSYEDTIHVEVEDIPQFTLGPDQKICEDGGETTLHGPANMRGYLWSTGDTTPDLKVSTPGTYWLTVFNKCFSATDTLMVSLEDPINIDFGPDTVLCHGESLLLNPGVVHLPLHWSDGTEEATNEITHSGTYWVWTQNSCGVVGDTIHVKFDNPLDPSIVDTTICDADTAIFDLSGIKYGFRWFDGSQDTIRKFTKEGTYNVSISNKCGDFTKVYHVHVSHCDCPFFVANSFTPNDDGTNDIFKIGQSCDLTNYNIEIFDRWGQEVYHSTDVNAGWDGTFNGAPAPEGVYTYHITYKWYVYGYDREKKRSGIIHLMR